VGSAAVELHGPHALLRSVAVDGGHRGGGLGRRLTREALELARSRGASEAFLLTETADAFFARLGFGPIERPAVPEPVRGSVEFVSACPASARVMSADLRGAGSR
jgi:amino-acid N-acetyltransferase